MTAWLAAVYHAHPIMWTYLCLCVGTGLGMLAYHLRRGR